MIFGAEAGPLMLTCAVMSAALASATISSTGSSFALPSKVIVPRVKVKVFPSRSTLPRICSREPAMTGAALVPVIVEAAAPFAFQPVPPHEDVAGHVESDIEGRRERRLTVGGGGQGSLAALAISFDDLQHDHIWRQAIRAG